MLSSRVNESSTCMLHIKKPTEVYQRLRRFGTYFENKTHTWVYYKNAKQLKFTTTVLDGRLIRVQ